MMFNYRLAVILAIGYTVMTSIWAAGMVLGAIFFLSLGAVLLALFSVGLLSLPIALNCLVWKKLRSIAKHEKS